MRYCHRTVLCKNYRSSHFSLSGYSIYHSTSLSVYDWQLLDCFFCKDSGLRDKALPFIIIEWKDLVQLPIILEKYKRNGLHISLLSQMKQLTGKVFYEITQSQVKGENVSWLGEVMHFSNKSTKSTGWLQYQGKLCLTTACFFPVEILPHYFIILFNTYLLRDHK